MPLDRVARRSRMPIADAVGAAHQRGHHPSRSQARQRDGHRRRHGEGARLRPRQDQAKTRTVTPTRRDADCRGSHRRGPHRRHGGLHVAGAGGGQACRSALGHVLARRHALRDGHREAPFGGDTHMSTLSAIIKDTPKSVQDVRPGLPRDVARSSIAASPRTSRSATSRPRTCATICARSRTT